MRLREKIKELDGSDFVRSRTGLCARGHSFGLQQNGEIARERRRIAGQVNNFRRLHFREFFRRCLAEPGARRIEYDQLRLLVEFLQEFFRMEVVRSHGESRCFRVGVQIANGGQICVDADNAFERFGQWKREEANSRVEIKRKSSLFSGNDSLQQIVDQEAIHLEKRQVAHAKIEAARFVRQIPRAGKLEAIFFLVQKEKALELRQRV